jgi:hypothetical protein
MAIPKEGSFKFKMAEYAFGAGAIAAWREGKCIDCREEALPKCYTDAGRREFEISGTCEVCYDKITAETMEPSLPKGEMI